MNLMIDVHHPLFWLAALGLLGCLGLGAAWVFGQRQRHAELLQLRREAQQLRALLNAIPDAVYFKDVDAAYSGCNPAFERCTGLIEAQMQGQRDEQLAQAPAWSAALDTASASQHTLSWVAQPNGERICLDVLKTHVFDGPHWLGQVGVARDVTALRHAMTQLHRAVTVFEHCGEGIMVLDTELLAQDVNPALCAITGFTCEELLGKVPRYLQAGEQEAVVLKQLWASVESQGKWSGELLGRHKNGDSLPLWATIVGVPAAEAQGEAHYLAVLTDISRIKQTEAELLRQSLHDSLTGLANLALLRDRLTQQISIAQRGQSCLAVLYLDLDGFREVNDMAGHAAGDAVLKEAASRFSRVLRASDSVARVGADEFVVLLTGEVNEKIALRLGERLIDSMREPIAVLGYAPFNLGASIGLAQFPHDSATVDELLSNAEAAMCRAKAHARNTVQAYLPELTQAVQQRFERIHALRQASEAGQFRLEYQPKVRLSDGGLIGAEALLRWQHPTRGLVSPVEFIPLAEETGLIIAIGRWVLETACAQAASWQGVADKPQQVAVNVSARQLRQPGFIDLVEEILSQTGCPATALELEVTESLLLEDADSAIALLDRLNARGVRIAIDDFGTGYSSLSYLRRMPVQTLKIDRSFVSELGSDASVAAIARTIIVLARSLQMDVIAEGVETAEQAAWLRREGCDWAQGWYYGRSMAPDDFQVLAHSLPAEPKLALQDRQLQAV